MAAINKETVKQLAESTEMKEFHRVLAIKHSNAIQRVLSRGGSAEDIIKRATKETKHLMEAERLAHKCPAGTIWDEVIGDCVPIG